MECNQSNHKPIETPFENIALAFSGGGFRAASFALGVLSYLNKIQTEDTSSLLHHVKYISAASGGSITTAMYALHNAKGQNFSDFYIDLYSHLQSDKLLKVVFNILNDDRVWENYPNKSRNLINAFSIAYDKKLFKYASLNDLQTPHNSTTHLEEICFNTTEFYHGLLFRQTVKMKEDAKQHEDTRFLYGNFNLSIDHTSAKHIRLGDILAASSCFPAGFEPMIFPNDFENKQSNLRDAINISHQLFSNSELEHVYGESVVQKIIQELPKPVDLKTIAEKLKNNKLSKELKIGFMDGGITDNQGIESMLKAHERRLKHETAFKPFDFMLINDVDTHFMEPHKPVNRSHNNKGIKLTINRLFVLAIIFLLGGFGLIKLSALYYVGFTIAQLLIGVGTILIFVSTIYIGLKAFSKRFIRQKLLAKDGADLGGVFSKDIVKNLLRFLGNTPVNVIKNMLMERMSSMITLSSLVFMARIRYLLYKQCIEGKDVRNRVKNNHIYDLSFSDDARFIFNEKCKDAYKLKCDPGTKMQIVAQYATDMDTTLWFDDTNGRKNESLAIIIACGQFTTCYNILEYIDRLKSSTIFDQFTEVYKQRINHIESQLKTDYEAFKTDPFFMYNDIGIAYKIPDFEKCDINKIPFPEEYNGLRK